MKLSFPSALIVAVATLHTVYSAPSFYVSIPQQLQQQLQQLQQQAESQFVFAIPQQRQQATAQQTQEELSLIHDIFEQARIQKENADMRKMYFALDKALRQEARENKATIESLYREQRREKRSISNS